MLCTMKYYRFSRRRKNWLLGNYEYMLRRKKSDYMINTGRSKRLDSFFFENQVWGALHKAWKGYVIAKNKDEFDKMLHYADIIQGSQHDLGLKISSFPDIGKSDSSFLWAIAQKDNNDNQEQEPLSEKGGGGEGEGEDEVDHQYEQERFTDAYTENYTDDPDYERERFADDNAYRENFTD